ncbi:hypothetical protein SASPL_106637 [Salvia splendens]|uniref:Uncharacterized protein n=1 Tax=Salvia splendens TaxID=180675 RepID=A0A8X8YRT0_SALSN|nr:hypothetical protein SASPL_106637 [Salvia splendens]
MQAVAREFILSEACYLTRLPDSAGFTPLPLSSSVVTIHCRLCSNLFISSFGTPYVFAYGAYNNKPLSFITLLNIVVCKWGRARLDNLIENPSNTDHTRHCRNPSRSAEGAHLFLNKTLNLRRRFTRDDEARQVSFSCLDSAKTL